MSGASTEFAQARAELIVEALRDADAPRRTSAIAAAARYLEPRVLAGLVANGEDATLRNAALEALEYQGPYAVGQLRAMLADPDSDVVMFALQVLARVRSPDTVSALLPLVTHANLNIAQAAVEALGRLQAAAAVPALVSLLAGDLWVRLAAVEALGEIGDPQAVGPLVAVLADPLVVEAAASALERLAEPASVGPLLDTLRTARERSVRDAAMLAVAATLERVQDPHPALRASAPEPAVRDFGRAVDRDRSTDGMLHYLSDILAHAAPTAGPAWGGAAAPDDRSRARDGGRLMRAATTLTLAAGIRMLFRLILVRAAEPEVAPWAEPLLARYASVLAPDLPEFSVDPDPHVRQGALLAAPHARAAFPHLLQLLRDEDAGVRAAACRALGAVGDASAIPGLVDRLRDGSEPERAAAAAGLGRMPGDRLEALGPCLRAQDEAVVVAALQVLETSGSPLFAERVDELGRDASAMLRCAALRVLAAQPGTRTEVALVRALADRDEQVQMEALDLLVRRGGPKVADTLLALLATGDSLRYYIIRALGKLGTAEAVPRLRALYPAVQLHERVEILKALDRIGHPDGVAFFWTCLDDPDAEVRRVAAHGVGRAARPEDLHLLVTLAGDADWGVRNAAALALGRLALPETRDTLLTLVRDVEAVVRHTARTSFERLVGAGA